jgi:hypothetical protein
MRISRTLSRRRRKSSELLTRDETSSWEFEILSAHCLVGQDRGITGKRSRHEAQDGVGR